MPTADVSIEAGLPLGGDGSYQNRTLSLKVNHEANRTDPHPQTEALSQTPMPDALPVTHQFKSVQAISEVPTACDPAANASFPSVGSEFCGFHLSSELGRGTFGRVYLARQQILSERNVVLKVGTQLRVESQLLAKLQHPNIVPVYSVHSHGRHQAVCMPYYGTVTLAQVVHRIRGTEATVLNGRTLRTVMQQCHRQTIPRTVQPNAQQGTTVQPGTNTPRTGVMQAVESPAFLNLQKYSYVEAALWIVRGLAAGLSAAHEHNIIHCDIKPANILLSDTGEPMLLDFGVAFDLHAKSNEVRVGGTRPYMSPEHLLSIRDQALHLDHRADIYSLGVILFELLTNQIPFPNNHDFTPAGINADLDERAVIPSVRNRNRNVPLAVEAIVRKCLALDAKTRYQSAKELEEDLTRQLAHRPLRFAGNPSRSELTGKWVRRHRTVLALAGVVAAGGVATGAVQWQYHAQQNRVVRFEQSERADLFEKQARAAQLQLSLVTLKPEDRPQAIEQVEDVVKQYLASSQGDPLRTLPPERQQAIRETLGIVHLSLARTAGTQAYLTRDAEQQAAWWKRAKHWNAECEHYFASSLPRAVSVQRAWLARMMGDELSAKSQEQLAQAQTCQTSLDLRLLGCELKDQGRWKEAHQRLQQALDLDPQDFWASFALGEVSYALGWDARAVNEFNRCLAIDSSLPGLRFYRGTALLRAQQFQRAAEDFSRVLDVEPENALAALNRASAREALKDYPGAIQDLGHAMDHGYPPTAVLMTRARVHQKNGDRAQAQADELAGLRERPSDERGWICRGIAHMSVPADAKPDVLEKALKMALYDFDQALDLNPQSETALQYKAHVYSRLNRNEDAVKVLTELLKHFPEAVDAYSGRAMLYARLKQRDKAHDDVQSALQYGESNPRTVYQLAGVYALTSKTEAKDKREAYRLLAQALRSNFGFDLLESDRELDPLRQEKEFETVVREAREFLRAKTKTRPRPDSDESN